MTGRVPTDPDEHTARDDRLPTPGGGPDMKITREEAEREGEDRSEDQQAERERGRPRMRYMNDDPNVDPDARIRYVADDNFWDD